MILLTPLFIPLFILYVICNLCISSVTQQEVYQNTQLLFLFLLFIELHNSGGWLIESSKIPLMASIEQDFVQFPTIFHIIHSQDFPIYLDKVGICNRRDSIYSVGPIFYVLISNDSTPPKKKICGNFESKTWKVAT